MNRPLTNAVVSATLCIVAVLWMVWGRSLHDDASYSRTRTKGPSDDGSALTTSSVTTLAPVHDPVSRATSEDTSGAALTEEEIADLTNPSYPFGGLCPGTPETDYTVDPDYARVVDRRASETTDDYVKRLWGYYYESTYRRLQGQILVSIAGALRRDKRYDEALQSLQLTINQHSEDAYFDSARREYFHQRSFRSQHDWNEYVAWNEHMTRFPDKAGDWARLEMAQVLLEQGFVSQAKQIWMDISQQRQHKGLRDADQQFLARAVGLTTRSSLLVGFSPHSPDAVPRPENRAVGFLVAQLEKDKEYAAAYEVYRKAYDNLSVPSNLMRIHRLAALAEKAGRDLDAAAWRRRGIAACDSALMANGVSITPRGAELWRSWRKMLEEQLNPSVSGPRPR